MLFDDYKLDHLNPNFIQSLKDRDQQLLWIGCSDSSSEETALLDLRQDEIIELRNLGNIMINDLACNSMVEYAIDILEVKHIVICGHYECGIIKASPSPGLKEPWLSVLNNLHTKYNNDSDSLDEDELDRRIVLSNIIEQIRHVEQLSKVANAIQQRGLKVHGIVYDGQSGRGYHLYKVGNGN